MANDENGPESPKKRASKPPPITQQQFLEELTALVDRATASGLRPLPIIARLSARLYAQQGLGVLDNWLATLEESTPKSRRGKK